LSVNSSLKLLRRISMAGTGPVLTTEIDASINIVSLLAISSRDRVAILKFKNKSIFKPKLTRREIC